MASQVRRKGTLICGVGPPHTHTHAHTHAHARTHRPHHTIPHVCASQKFGGTAMLHNLLYIWGRWRCLSLCIQLKYRYSVLVIMTTLIVISNKGTNFYRLTFRHRASCILGQAFHYFPENVFYIFNQQIYFII